jgi:hypothetical protein
MSAKKQVVLLLVVLVVGFIWLTNSFHSATNEPIGNNQAYQESGDGSEKMTGEPIADQIKPAMNESVGYWNTVNSYSTEYAEALHINAQQIQQMEELESIVVVNSPKGIINLIAKNTCGAPYGDTWRYLLQARPANLKITGVGGGTTFISALDSKDHEMVLAAIKEGKYKLKKGHLWP